MGKKAGQHSESRKKKMDWGSNRRACCTQDLFPCCCCNSVQPKGKRKKDLTWLNYISCLLYVYSAIVWHAISTSSAYNTVAQLLAAIYYYYTSPRPLFLVLGLIVLTHKLVLSYIFTIYSTYYGSTYILSLRFVIELGLYIYSTLSSGGLI